LNSCELASQPAGFLDLPFTFHDYCDEEGIGIYLLKDKSELGLSPPMPHH
jgi:hypothetical protein